jgi:hypothetical protein
MRFDNLFVQKEKGFGWTLNFQNPLTGILLAVFLLLLVVMNFRRIKEWVLLAAAFVFSLFKKH